MNINKFANIVFVVIVLVLADNYSSTLGATAGFFGYHSMRCTPMFFTFRQTNLSNFLQSNNLYQDKALLEI